MAIDQEPPLPQLQIKIDREAAARFGINVSDIADLIETAIGGKALSFVFINERRYDIAVRFVGVSARNNPDAIARLALTSSDRRAHSARTSRPRCRSVLAKAPSRAK